VSFATHFFASFVGYLLPVFLVSYFGQQLFDMMKGVPAETWALVALLAAIGIATFFVVQRSKKKPLSAPDGRPEG
jgi:hypothetical protein